MKEVRVNPRSDCALVVMWCRRKRHPTSWETTVMSKRSAILGSIVALALAGTSLPALAQTPAPATKTKEEKREARANLEAQFKAADKSGDGGLSKAELAQAMTLPGSSPAFKVMDANFDAMDTNKDGRVTLAERDAWIKARAAAKKAAEPKK